MHIDRRHFIASLGGTAAIAAMSSEAKAEALEAYMVQQVNSGQAQRFPTVAEVEAQIETRHFRRGVGNLFVATGQGATMRKLEPMPEKPTFLDYFRLRFGPTANHNLQSATRALQTGMTEEIIFACLIHDTGHALMRADHGYFVAQLYEPYVSEKVTFAVRYHQALRFYADTEAGYEYPDLYHRMFGEDYVPPAYIQEHYKMVRNHRWYMEPRLVTVNDLYAFDPNAVVSLDPFIDIAGRQFKQPPEGLGNDNSPSAHMWRAIGHPDAPL